MRERDDLRDQASVNDAPHLGLVVSPFKEFQGVYEHHKTQALAEHLRRVADIVSRAQIVRPCPKAPERPWVGLHEWVENSGLRAGQWISDIECVDCGTPPQREAPPSLEAHSFHG